MELLKYYTKIDSHHRIIQERLEAVYVYQKCWILQQMQRKSRSCTYTDSTRPKSTEISAFFVWHRPNTNLPDVSNSNDETPSHYFLKCPKYAASGQGLPSPQADTDSGQAQHQHKQHSNVIKIINGWTPNTIIQREFKCGKFGTRIHIQYQKILVKIANLLL